MATPGGQTPWPYADLSAVANEPNAIVVYANAQQGGFLNLTTGIVFEMSSTADFAVIMATSQLSDGVDYLGAETNQIGNQFSNLAADTTYFFRAYGTEN